jgi:hypothetical protein
MTRIIRVRRTMISLSQLAGAGVLRLVKKVLGHTAPPRVLGPQRSESDGRPRGRGLLRVGLVTQPAVTSHGNGGRRIGPCRDYKRAAPWQPGPSGGRRKPDRQPGPTGTTRLPNDESKTFLCRQQRGLAYSGHAYRNQPYLCPR